MDTTAVVFAAPGRLALEVLPLIPPDGASALVDVCFSGISTGTERLLWTGDMPAFPGMGYPLVPGYETVGRVSRAPSHSGLHEGDLVFVPGASCYGAVRGLFGGAASRIATAPAKLVKIDESLLESGTMLALAATAHHAVKLARLPDLIVGHGALGRLAARIVIALGGSPTVWETDDQRMGGAKSYRVVQPNLDERRDYGCILDASGDTQIIDRAMKHLARHGEIVLAGFYSEPLHFVFPPAFMREATLRIAAQWDQADLTAVLDLVSAGKLSLDGLVTHRSPAADAPVAYETAFTHPGCLKMVLDWRTFQ
ncbi:chlorophyll synthesis pathway protein BchC [Aestuariivirga sp.]|uniref:chlorophyll synthesis pathway protein BchC n=1 Tax=Aestuariivirga sp. TaxID=2650926 RepID=UPI0039E2EC4A